MPGETISIRAKDDGTFSGYLARPAQGSGPGLVLLGDDLRAIADRYAEEGYVTFAPALSGPGAVEEMAAAVAGLRARPEQAGGVGCIGFGRFAPLAIAAAARGGIDCVIGHGPVDPASLAGVAVPLMLHVGADDPAAPAGIEAPGATVHVYPGCGAELDKPASLIAYSRTLGLLRQVLGPVYDLTALWENHCYHEFAARDVDATMATMVAEPYVNHIPTMTGGVGHDHLKRFYRYHFVNANPDDTRLIPISRTVGADRVVDEMLFCFTHTREIDWMLPGVPPTGRYVEVPLVAIIRFRGDKLYNEHIYWDQASVLVQIGKLDPTGLPVAGVETARKLVDEALPSNTLMAAWASSEGKPI